MTETREVLAARLAGSRAAFARLLADGDAFTRYGGAAWMPFRAVTLVAPDGSIQWDSTHLPDTLVEVAR